MSDALRVFLDVPKSASARSHIRVALDEFKGHLLVDIRETVLLSQSCGVRSPTGKGIAFSRDLLGPVLEALLAAYEAHHGSPYEAQH